MNLLVTTSKSFLALDTDTGNRCVIHDGKGLYYGISYSDNKIFVGCRNNNDCFNYLDTLQNESGMILVFDYSLNLIDTLSSPFPLRDLHQILWFDDKLWITCSGDNMIAVLEEDTWKKWYPAGNLDHGGKDITHFNSLFYDGVDLYVLAHNFGASEIWHFSYPNLELIKKIKIGYQAHNIWSCSGELFVCDSQNGDICSTEGLRVKIGGFPRGVVSSEDAIFIGTSDVAERSMRNEVSSRIVVFDSLLNQKDEFFIEGHGQLLDLRAPGINDLCVPGFIGGSNEAIGKNIY